MICLPQPNQMTPKPTYDLSIILPVCKPSAEWANTLINNVQDIRRLLPATNIEFIVVNDGYETEQLLCLFDVLKENSKALRFISYPANMGKGYALRVGVNAATARFTITTDSDFPYAGENIVEVYKKLVSGFDIVAGKRSADYYRAIPYKRKLISKGCIALNRVLLGLPDCDTQSGLKGFNLNGKRLFLYTKINRFLIDTEFLMMAYKRRLLIAVIPLQLKPEIKFSSIGWKVLFTEAKNLVSILKKKSFNDANIHTYHVQPENLPDVRFRRV